MKRISPTEVEIHLEALRWNYRQLRRRLPKSFKTMAVVKSDAYGHGAVAVAKGLREADAFGVGTIDEGVELRRAGIKKPILVLLGLIEGSESELLRHRLTPVIYHLDTAHRLNAWLRARHRSLDVQVKVDTGMTRLGVLPSELTQFLIGLQRLKNLCPVGLLSHLSDASHADFTKKQVDAFFQSIELFHQFFPGKKMLHIANSLATMHGGGLGKRSPDSQAEWMGRLGIALYGAYPDGVDKDVSLRPVMRWRSRLVSLKRVPKKTFVSYGRTYRTHRPSRIGVVPVGYADGYFRNLSNRAEVLIRGKRIPIVGRVCMDMMMVDVTRDPEIRIGDEVVLLGRQQGAEIRAEELAQLAGTISYEIFCRVAARLPRRYLEKL